MFVGPLTACHLLPEVVEWQQLLFFLPHQQVVYGKAVYLVFVVNWLPVPASSRKQGFTELLGYLDGFVHNMQEKIKLLLCIRLHCSHQRRNQSFFYEAVCRIDLECMQQGKQPGLRRLFALEWVDELFKTFEHNNILPFWLVPASNQRQQSGLVNYLQQLFVVVECQNCLVCQDPYALEQIYDDAWRLLIPNQHCCRTVDYLLS